MASLLPVIFTISLLPDRITVSLETVGVRLVLFAEYVRVPTVGSMGCDIALTLPAASIAVAVNVYEPLDS